MASLNSSIVYSGADEERSLIRIVSDKDCPGFSIIDVDNEVEIRIEADQIDDLVSVIMLAKKELVGEKKKGADRGKPE